MDTHGASHQMVCADSCMDDCFECRDVCIRTGTVDCTSSCKLSCDCSDDNERCHEWEHEFDFGPPDAEMEVTCVRNNIALYDQDCVTVPRPPHDCPVLAAIASQEFEASLECEIEIVSTTERCTGWWWTPCRSPGTSVPAERFKEGLTSSCPGLVPHFAQDMEDLIGMGHPGIAVLAEECLEENTCIDVEECLGAMLSAADERFL